MKKKGKSARQIAITRRKKKEEERQIEVGYIETIARLLRRSGYREATVADHVSRLRLSRRALSYLIKLERTSIAEIQLSALTGSGLFSLRGSTTKGERVAREVLEALIEFNKNNLRLLEESASIWPGAF